MAWVKVPAEHPPIFRAALPKDPRLETLPMFGGLAAKVNGHFFAGLFARSVVLDLPDAMREEVLALEGATHFDPMGDGRRMSRKVMLPEAFMEEPDELRRWVKRAFDEAAKRPAKRAETKAKKKKGAPAKGATKTGAAASPGESAKGSRVQAKKKAAPREAARVKLAASRSRAR
ncbi:MAG: TfoX/Sxy family protein [Sandaracinus sp.]